MTSCHSDFLEAKLLESLRSETEQAVNISFELAERDSSGAIIGGLVASVSYSWLLIKIVWVDKSHRNRGIAKNLMSQAEQKAITLGCHLDRESLTQDLFSIKLYKLNEFELTALGEN